MKERTILHCDVNNFFASVECATRPELNDKPVAVTGNPKKRTGIILAKNEIAKKMGVKTGQAIWEAKQSCPDLVTLAPHYDVYEDISAQLQELYLDYTDFVEPLGLDECWLDVTGSLNYLKKTGKEIADELRQRIKAQFGFTVSVGVSFSKVFAKLGSDMKKPDATTEIPRENFKEIVYPLPLSSIVGIGRRLDKKFAKMNVTTIGDFVELPPKYLDEIIGITAVRLRESLRGERIEPVLNYYHLPPPKSVGNGTTTIVDIIKRKDIEATIAFLAQKVSSRLAAHKMQCSCISVSLKTANFERLHKSHKIAPTNEAIALAHEAMRLIDSFYRYDKPLRAIRLKGSMLSPDNAVQLSLFDKPTPRNSSKNLTQTIELINKKYGKIALASDSKEFLNNAKNPHE